MRGLFILCSIMLVSSITLAQDLTHLHESMDHFIDLDQYEQGLKKAEELLKKSPNDPTLFLYRAIFYLNLDKSQESIQEINQAIRLAPDHERSYFVKSLIYADQQNWEQALFEIESALAIAPNLSEFVAYKAVYLLHLKRFNQVFDLMKAQLMLYPQDAYVSSCIALAAHLMGKRETAIENIQHAYSLDHGSPFVNTIYGLIKYAQTDYSSSMQYFLKTIYAQENELLNITNRVAVFVKTKKNVEAIEQLNHLVQKSKNYGIVSSYKKTLRNYIDPKIHLSTEEFYCALFRPWRSLHTDVIEWLQSPDTKLMEAQKIMVPVYKVYLGLYAGLPLTEKLYSEALDQVDVNNIHKVYTGFIVNYYNNPLDKACTNLIFPKNDYEGIEVYQNICK